LETIFLINKPTKKGTFVTSSSQNQFYPQIIKLLELFFVIQNPIDYSEYRIQRSNFESWDQLYLKY